MRAFLVPERVPFAKRAYGTPLMSWFQGEHASAVSVLSVIQSMTDDLLYWDILSVDMNSLPSPSSRRQRT